MPELNCLSFHNTLRHYNQPKHSSIGLVQIMMQITWNSIAFPFGPLVIPLQVLKEFHNRIKCRQ